MLPPVSIADLPGIPPDMNPDGYNFPFDFPAAATVYNVPADIAMRAAQGLLLIELSNTKITPETKATCELISSGGPLTWDDVNRINNYFTQSTSEDPLWEAHGGEAGANWVSMLVHNAGVYSAGPSPDTLYSSSVYNVLRSIRAETGKEPSMSDDQDQPLGDDDEPDIEDEAEPDNFDVPVAIQGNARAGLSLVQKYKLDISADVLQVGQSLASGTVDLATVEQINDFLVQNKQTDLTDKTGPNFVCWMLHGGTAALEWTDMVMAADDDDDDDGDDDGSGSLSGDPVGDPENDRYGNDFDHQVQYKPDDLPVRFISEYSPLVRAQNLRTFSAARLTASLEDGAEAHLDLYVAHTPNQRAQGLSSLAKLDKAGMIFVYGEESNAAFHMKNMKMDLDMAWLDADGKVVQARSMSSGYIGPIVCNEPFHYVLEAPKGTLAGLTSVAVEHLDIARTFTTKQRKKLADSGAALSDGSFPIVNATDLHNAIQAIGRAKNPAAAKAHIISRAKALGLTSALPDSWKSTSTAAANFKTIPVGTKVSWPYRGTRGHGTVAGVHKLGTNAANTEYSIKEIDHHPGEPAVVFHYGRVLTRE